MELDINTVSGIQLAPYTKKVVEKVEPVEPEEVVNLMTESCSEKHDLITESAVTRDSENIRAVCIAAAIEWVEMGGDYDDLDSLAVGIADIDEDGEISEDEDDDYNATLKCLGKALMALGASASDVNSLIEDEDDNLADDVVLAIKAALKKTDKAQDDIISTFSKSGSLMLEAVKKVIKDGKVKFVKKRLKKRRMSALQRQALKKARRKAHSGSARRNRKKSMKARKSRGM